MKYPVGTEVIYDCEPAVVIGVSMHCSPRLIVIEDAGGSLYHASELELSPFPRTVEEIALDVVEDWYEYPTANRAINENLLHALVLAAIEEARDAR